MFEPANLEELAKVVHSFITPEVVSEAKRSKLNDHLRHKSQAHPSRASCSGKSPKAVFPVGKTDGLDAHAPRQYRNTPAQPG